MGAVQIFILILILIVVIGIGIAFIVNAEVEKKTRSLSVIRGQSVGKTIEQKEKAEQDKRRAELSKKLADEKVEAAKNKDKVTIADMIAQAGLEISVQQFWLLSFAGMIILPLLAKLMGGTPFVMGMLAIIGLFGLPRFVLKNMAKKRQKKFMEELPDALEAMVRLLKAGMPVAEAISMVSREFEGPLGEEMSRIYDKQKIGVALHEAALECTRRMPLTEVNMFATGLAIQAQTGASLSEVLMNLSGVIRARFRLRRKVKALASEAVASASIIGALPLVVAGGMWFVNREYINVLFTDPFGKVLLAGAVIWMAIGILVMRAMINFKV